MFEVMLDDWANPRFPLECRLTISETICTRRAGDSKVSAGRTNIQAAGDRYPVISEDLVYRSVWLPARRLFITN
jgi:hypothetical protein